MSIFLFDYASPLVDRLNTFKGGEISQVEWKTGMLHEAKKWKVYIYIVILLKKEIYFEKVIKQIDIIKKIKL